MSFYEYIPGLDINEVAAEFSPRNCAVRERTADGTPVGPCTHYLIDGVRCPRHGVVRRLVTHEQHPKNATPARGSSDWVESYDD